jgi:inosose dehydratase
MTRLSSSTLSCDGFEDNDFRNTFKYMRSIGFRHIELNMWHPDNLTPRKVRDVRRRCDEASLVPIAVYGSGFSCSVDKEIAHKIRMIDVACELGCRRIVTSGSGDPSYSLDAIVACLDEVQHYAEEQDVLVCLENHANNTLESLEDYESVFSAIPSAHVGLCIDTGHFEAAGIALDDVVDRFGSRTNHIHVKENKGFGTKNFTFFGQGDTDNIGLVERLVGMGYSGFVNVELSPEIGGAKSGDIPSLDELRKAFDLFCRFDTSGEVH